MSDLVPVAPFREAFLRSGMSAADLARRLGWYNEKKNVADGPRVTRRLGLRPEGPDRRSNGKVHGRGAEKMVTYEIAVQLADALDLDYWEVGV